METDQLYTNGFNSGYMLAKYNPTLLNSIAATLSPNNLYLEGMINGKQELELEHIKDQLKEVENLRANSSSRENDIRRG